MKKILSILFIIFIIFLNIPVSFAVVDVETSFEKPVPLYDDNGSNIHIILYWVSYNNGTYLLNCLNAYYPTTTHFYVSGNSQSGSMYRTDSQPMSGSVTVYNMSTGNLQSTSSANGTQYNSTIGNLNSPNYFRWVNNTIDNGFFPTDNNFHVDTQGATAINVSWYEPKGDIIRSNIPQPLSDFTHYYIADDQCLYQLVVNYPFYLQSVGLYGSNLLAEEIYQQFYVSLIKNNSNSVLISVHNRSEHDITCYLNTYNIINGEFINSTSFNVAQANNSDTIYNYILPVHNPEIDGIWFSGFINMNDFPSFDKLQISWSDTIDYSNDFLTIETLLGTLQNQVISSLSSIESIITSLLTTVNNIYTLLSTDFNWFKTTYFNTITNKWDITKQQLDSIIDILHGDGQQTTLPIDSDVSENVSEYLSQESNYMDQFDEAGSDIDYVFNDVSSQFVANASGFAFVKMLLETFVFDIPHMYIIVIFSLTFGIVILILGKVMR